MVPPCSGTECYRPPPHPRRPTSRPRRHWPGSQYCQGQAQRNPVTGEKGYRLRCPRERRANQNYGLQLANHRKCTLDISPQRYPKDLVASFSFVLSDESIFILVFSVWDKRYWMAILAHEKILISMSFTRKSIQKLYRTTDSYETILDRNLAF